jgi:hypothetical protein
VLADPPLGSSVANKMVIAMRRPAIQPPILAEDGSGQRRRRVLWMLHVT